MNRLTALFLTIPLALPLAAAKPAGKFTLGVYAGTPTLSGHFKENGGAANDFKTNFDLEKDLGLETDGMATGLYVSYLGSRFGLSVDYLPTSYAGDKSFKGSVWVDGNELKGTGNLTSSLDTKIMDVNMTIKVIRISTFWLGVDLGAQIWNVEGKVSGLLKSDDYPDLPPEPQGPYSVAPITIPVPQVGLSAGFTALGNRLEARGRFSAIAYNGVSYQRVGADARFYVLPWLGVRAFFDGQSLDVPNGSVIEDMEAGLGRSIVGFGVALRF